MICRWVEGVTDFIGLPPVSEECDGLEREGQPRVLRQSLLAYTYSSGFVLRVPFLQGWSKTTPGDELYLGTGGFFTGEHRKAFTGCLIQHGPSWIGGS